MLPIYSRTVSALLGVALLTATAWGKDFRVENKVFSGNAAEAESQGTTIFAGGQVYDFLDQPAEAVVLDPANERFLLLDSVRRVTAEVSTKEVVAFNERQKHLAMEQPSPVMNFFGNPLFQESFDRGASELTLSSAWVTYKVKLAAADKDIVAQYRQFSDWYARLNAGLNPKARPPFARMKVDEAIARRDAIPAEVQMSATLKGPSGERQATIRCEYRLVPQLTKADMDRVEAVQQNIKAFRPIRFDQYRRGEK